MIRPAENGKPEHRHWKLANPDPTPRDFVRINRQHKIILAELDTGIDYNHPQLIENMHFDLDEAGKPVGMGHDYLAFDDWSYYRAIETNLYPFEDRTEETQQEILKTDTPETWNSKVAEQLNPIECHMRAMKSVDAVGLTRYVHTYRSRDSDTDSDYTHGTHVAGLMTYDRPDFGLISYRILPYHQTKAQKRAESLAQVDVFQLAFQDAVRRAASRGAKIVNMSLGGTIESPSDSTSAKGQKAYAEFLKRKQVFADDMAAEMRKYPGILFVAAAGNDGGFSNNDSRVQAPCGIDAPNLLCVGALNPNGLRTQFTNLPFSKGAMVYAPGYDILSLKPHDTCPEFYSFLGGIEKGTGGERLCKFDPKKEVWIEDQSVIDRYSPLFRGIAQSCADPRNDYVRMSGTSMATPLVTHMAAEVWVDHPEIERAEDLIPLLKTKFAVRPSQDAELAKRAPPDSLSPKIPSWYGKETLFVERWEPTGDSGTVARSSPSTVRTTQLSTPSGEKVTVKYSLTIGKHSRGGAK